MSGRFLSEDNKQKIRQRRRQRRIVVSTMTQWIIGLAVAAVILLNLFTHVLQIVRYNGRGMEPNLHSGQMLLLQKTQDVGEGDIIAFYYNNQILVRRVICPGGKQINFNADGTVLVDGEEQEESYLQEKSVGQYNIELPHYVPNNCYFVMGDNRAVAMDSRLKEIGPVPRDRIIGKVLLAL